ncbi:DUF2855 family protein [Maricaulis sp. CAU 1757]
MTWALSIDRKQIGDARLVEETSRPLRPGEARLAIRRFALTANNITYAAFGEAMRYWDFFPGYDGRGRLPVWGFAEVAESRCDGLDPGERIYGYFPAAEELVVRPERIDKASFVDATAHRAELPPAYNRYVRCAGDASWSTAREAAQMVLQPLFITSFLIAHFLREEKAFGAEIISLTSASSKTALALAWLLKADPVDGTRVQALTSPGSRDFVEGLGLYDEVVLYGSVEQLPVEPSYTLVDFAGDGAVNTALHTRLADRLQANVRVGGAHWENSAPVSGLPGPKPQFFFAPDHVRTRIKEWGQAEFEARYRSAWDGFVEAADGFLDYAEHEGGAGTLDVYGALLRGDVPARRAETIRV